MGRVLFINACAREESRTLRLAGHLLEKLGRYDEIRLYDTDFPKTDEKFLAMRDKAFENDYKAPVFDMARQFRDAETVVIAAPYWDLSFPAVLKQYLEHINVVGLTFGYENGMPKSLCSVGRVYYVQTAGGMVVSDEFGFGYVKKFFELFYQVEKFELIKAEGLDIIGNDPEKILKGVISEIDARS